MNTIQWYAKDTGSNQGLIISEANGDNIAVSYSLDNMHLLAAAPDLLTACITALETLNDTSNPWHYDTTRNILRAAIANAKGAI